MTLSKLTFEDDKGESNVFVEKYPTLNAEVEGETANAKIEYVADEENMLTAFGDISLSTIDFVPGPPSVLTPVQKQRRENKPRDTLPLPTIVRKVLPPGPAKANLRKTEPTFEMMVEDLQRLRKESLKSSDVTSALHAPQPSLLADLKNFGPEAVIARVDAVIANDGSHDAVQNYAPPTTKQCAGVPDEKGACPIGAVNKPKKGGLRGNAKLPKRLPIPRWDFDNDLVKHEAKGQFGLTSHLFLT